MSIRMKLLLLLLAIAIFPMLVLNVFTLISMKEMGREISDAGKQALINHEQAYLKEKISDASIILRHHFKLLKLAIVDQAVAVEKSLRMEPDDHQVTMADDFDAGLVDTIVNKKYIRRLPDGNTQMLPVSYDTPVFLKAPGVENSTVRFDMARLSTMTDTYRSIHEHLPSRMTWHYTSLENGLHNALPGHGYYPEGYDPRKRPWYLEAINADSPVWTRPVIDASTRQMINTIAVKIYRPDGKLAGVTAIDFTVPDILNVGASGFNEWEKRTAVIVIGAADNQKLAILGHQVYDDKTLIWDRPDEKTYITDPDGRIYDLFMQAKENGSVVLKKGPYLGEESLWGFTPLNTKGVFLLVGVPMSKIRAKAETREIENYVFTRYSKHALILIGSLMITIIIVTIIVFYTSRNITKPLFNLSHTADKIAKGELNSRISLKRNDEIGSLCRSVNEMANSIEALLTEQESAYLQMLDTLSNALEAKDAYTAMHSKRVAEFAVSLGKRIGLNERTLDLLERGALVHDLGKIGIPDHILNKKDTLNEDETEVMRFHPVHTAAIMRPLVRFKEFAQIAAWHHEHWDGSGYPDGLTGNEIPLLAQIVAIADTWDAMTGDRVYRKRISKKDALSVLISEKEKGWFDPELICKFIEMIQEDIAIPDKEKDDEMFLSAN